MCGIKGYMYIYIYVYINKYMQEIKRLMEFTVGCKISTSFLGGAETPIGLKVGARAGFTRIMQRFFCWR